MNKRHFKSSVPQNYCFLSLTVFVGVSLTCLRGTRKWCSARRRPPTAWLSSPAPQSTTSGCRQSLEPRGVATSAPPSPPVRVNVREGLCFPIWVGVCRQIAGKQFDANFFCCSCEFVLCASETKRPSLEIKKEIHLARHMESILDPSKEPIESAGGGSRNLEG